MRERPRLRLNQANRTATKQKSEEGRSREVGVRGRVASPRLGNGALGEIRTHDLCLRRAALYPLSYKRAMAGTRPET